MSQWSHAMDAYAEDYTRGYDHAVAVRLLGFLRPYWRRILLALVLVFVHAGTSLAQPYLIKVAIDEGVVARDVNVLTLAALAYVAVLLGNAVASWGHTYVLSLMGQRVLYDIRTTLFRHLQSLSLRFFDRETIGRIISRLTSDVSTLNEILTQGLVGSLADLAIVVGIVAVMFQMSPRLSLFTFAVLPVMLLAARWFAIASRSAYRQVRLAIAEVNSSLAESIVGMRVIQAFRREEYDAHRFDEVNRANLMAVRHATAVSSTIMPALDVFNAIGTGLILWFGGRAILGGEDELTIGILTAFMLYVERFFEPIRELSSRYDTLQAAMASGERIFQLLDTPPQVRDRPGAVVLPRLRGEVVFDGVTFGYSEDDPVVRDFSFEARPGERVALVGATGAGKSTIIRLLCRFYDVQSGRVLVDGYDVRDVAQESLRRQIGLVLQDPFLFSGTIRDNIAYGRLEASDEEIATVSRAVGLDVAIERQSHGYQTLVEERGSNLSVGERQLVGIARALLGDPRILILDEATSNIDTQTEEIVQRGLEVLMRGRTCFIIAHRLATVRNASRIIVLHQGRIVEMGTHRQLLERNGHYHRLHSLGFPYGEDEGLRSEAERNRVQRADPAKFGL